MSRTIDKAHIYTFEANVRHLAQQVDARIRPYVQEKQKGTAKDHFPRTAARGTMATKTAGNQVATSTVIENQVYSNRVVSPVIRQTAEYIEKEDIARVLIDPKAAVAQSIAAQCRRTIDKLIITAADAAALDEAGGSNAFPAGQDLGGTTQAFDFDLVTQVAEKFMANDIDPDTRKVFLVGPNEVRKMLAMDEATNSDYVNSKALASRGFVDSWMGFTWVMTNQLAVPDTSQRYLLAFTDRALGLLVEHDIQIRVDELPTQSYDWQIYAELSMGCVRVEDEQIVRIKVLES